MPSIVTVTFNPCLDKSSTVDSLLPDKKLYCPAFRSEAGGGGINVAKAIKKLGENNLLAVYLAGGYTGVLLKTLLKSEKIDIWAIDTGAETRENIMIVDKATNLQYRFITPGIPVKKNYWQQCLRITEKIADVNYLIVSGSVQEGCPKDIFISLAKIADRKKAKLIIDVPGNTIRDYPIKNAYLIKPNLNELSLLAGKNELNGNEIISAAKDIIAKNISEIVVVSMGAAGALLVTNEMAEQIMAPPVRRKSTVGAGDSMVAGIVMYLLSKRSIKDAVRFGVACGTAATMCEGSQLFHPADVKKLYKLILRK